MKIMSLLLLSAVLYSASYAQNLKTPAPSPGQTVKQDFALSTVEVSYSRPGVKNRKVFGELVPFGKVWRTGANQATTITFGEEVMFGGKTIPAGKYGLLSIPGENEWTIILTKSLDVTSPSAYKEANDVARIAVKPEKMSFSIENFIIAFDNIKPSSMDMMIAWENTVVMIPLKAEIDSKVMLEIDKMMKTDNPPYFSAAMYYLESGKDLAKASSWLDKAIEKDPKAFYIYHQKANVLAKMGKKQEAIAVANKSIELSKAAKNEDYVLLNQKLIASLK